MPFKKSAFHVVLPSLLAIASIAASPAYAQRSTRGTFAPSPATRFASDLGPVNPEEESNITVELKAKDQAAFDKIVEALYDPSSPTYHHWLTNEDLKRYAPTTEQIESVKKELENHGLTILSASENGFSIRAHGSNAQLEQAFSTQLHQFQHNGKVFRATIEEARLTGAAGDYVAGISGLESHKVHPLFKRAINVRTNQPFPSVPLSKVQATSSGLSSLITDQILTAPSVYTFNTTGASLPVGVYYGNGYNYNATTGVLPDYTPAQLQAAYGLTSAYKQELNGKGQTIVLLEAYGYPTIEQDANAFFSLTGLPLLSSSNFQIIYPEGQPVSPNAGILTGWDGEIALDVQWAHTIAPGAKIIVAAAAGQDSEDFVASINYITNHDLGNSVSDSWETDTDIIAGPAEDEAYDAALERAAAKGISFQFSTGDGGDSGLGTPVGAPGVPSNSPHGTAVGGTAILNVVGGSGTQTLGWGDSATFLAAGGPLDPPEPYGLLGGAGGGESLYFAKPSWQKSLPGTGRQVPDVSALADPYTGVPIVLTVGTQQEIEAGNGGTSLASPIFTAFWAIANQKAGHALGQAAPTIAALKSGLLDVLPLSSPTNVTGTVIDQNGATFYSATALFQGLLDNTTGFTSSVWNLGSGEYLDLGFGIDSSLTVTKGWDNVTGYGTPNGLTFINAVAAAATSTK
jgi:subtilase family serine protease